MSLINRVLPQPVTTLAILALWMALATTPSLGNLLLGAVLGITIPWATARFWPDTPRFVRPALAVAVFARVIGDILVANWQVARLVVGPLDRLHPKFVEVPLEIDSPFVATLLGSIVSLTPGTVSIEIDRARKVLFVHALNVGDEAAMIATIKARYEAPLKEIFAC